MTPEIQSALNTFAVAVILAAAAAVGGIGVFLKAYFERRDKVKTAFEEEALKEREQTRQAELAKMRRATAVAEEKAAKAQADAAEAKAMNVSMENLSAAVLQLIQSTNASDHATRIELTNTAESVGVMAESLDKMALELNDNNRITKTAANEMSKLYNKLAIVFPNETSIQKQFDDLIRTIEKACEERKNSSEDIAVIPPPADELPKAG